MRSEVPRFPAGPTLLDLPVDIIQEVKTYFSASEWARGPCQTCKLLHQLPWRALPVTIVYNAKVRVLCTKYFLPAVSNAAASA